MIEHRSLRGLFLDKDNWYHLSNEDICTLFHSYGFDFSVWEIWFAFLNGCHLALVPYGTACSPETFTQFLYKKRVTVLSITPSVLDQVISYQSSIKKRYPLFLRMVIVGGEALPADMVDRYIHMLPNTDLFNEYGPTESTVWSTHTRIYEAKAKKRYKVTIGKPIANREIYILDSYKQPLPVNVVGELYIGGAGLAREYLNRYELTQEKFIPNPFKEKSRLYRTGDLVRYTTEGFVEYIGRNDYQIKFRGYRVELGEIDSLVNQNSAIENNITIVREDRVGDKRITTYIVPKASYYQHKIKEFQEEQIERWREVYNNAYQQQISNTSLGFNTIGWVSSYTRQPIPNEEMQEWVDSTVEAISKLAPQKVLEIGCGTGLILSRLAPLCEEYCGTDISEESIKNINSLKIENGNLSHVTLFHRRADNVEGLPKGAFDVVVLNSVVQYFPHINYLIEVLQNILPLLKENGCIFIGDVRNFDFLESFHLSTSLFNIKNSEKLYDLKLKIQKNIHEESELLISPKFFSSISSILPSIKWAEKLLKRGKYNNEMTRYRYNVILHTKNNNTFDSALEIVWGAEKPSTIKIKQILKDKALEYLKIKEVPNARLSNEKQAIEWLKMLDDSDVVATLRSKININLNDGIDPEDLYEIAEYLDYDISLELNENSEDGYYDVTFKKNKSIVNDNYIGITSHTPSATDKLYNNPIENHVYRDIIPTLLGSLKSYLPDYMVPRSFVILNKLPQTPNGKIDIKCLPAPSYHTRISVTEYSPPKSNLERKLCVIWQDLLQIEKIGTRDSFFELGGHSLLATQIIGRIRLAFHKEIPFRDFFEHPTIIELAKLIEESDASLTHGLPLISERSVNNNIPLSFGQQRLWFLEQLLPGIGLYNIPISISLKGNLDLNAA